MRTQWLKPALLAFGFCAWGKLPIKVYTIDDGLPRNKILRVVADARGLLWFCTPEGLSRFDGSYFTNYGTAEGLPSPQINDFLVTRAGTYWVATSAGLARFEPRSVSSSRFLAHVPQLRPVNRLLQDAIGNLWIAAESGVYRLPNPDAPAPGQPEAIDALRGISAVALAEGPDTSLWLGTTTGILRRMPGGAMERFGVAEGLPSPLVTSLAIDGYGRVWAGTMRGLCELVKSNGAYRVALVITQRSGLAGSRVLALHQGQDGHIWVGSMNGLSELVPSADGAEPQIRLLENRNSLQTEILNSVTEDLFHNLWLGTDQAGAIKVLHGGLQSYAESDGLSGPPVLGFFEDLQGRLHAVNGRYQAISRLEDGAFVSVRPEYGADVVNLGFRRGQIALQDREGDWWIATFSGLYRFGGANRIEELRNRPPKVIYTEHHGLASHRISRVYQDARGDIWVAPSPSGLSRWERRTRKFEHYSGIPQLQGPAVNGFAEDSRGNVWISLDDRLAVYRDGKFEFFGREAGLPSSNILCILIDRADRLWFGTDKDGLGRVDHPAARPWKVQMYSIADHLSSNSVESLLEDGWGRIYAGTGRGLDRLDPRTGRMRAYGAADGFSRGFVRATFRDRQGHLWFGTTRGASELLASQDDDLPAPHVLISGIRVRGRRYPVSELGEAAIPAFTLSPLDNQLEISLTSVGTGSDVPAQYQYRLKPSSREWTLPTSDRVVNLVGLGPGSYRFEAKAVASDGRENEDHATAEFVVLAPLWTRWWFLSLAASAASAMAFWLHRRRLYQALQLERVRTRIATDLHDDVGSSLSQIAILSEIVRRQSHNGAEEIRQILSDIAGTARELVDSMGDIVWAIDPEHDQMDDLSHRMRRFAEDMCAAREIALSFRGPDSCRMAADAHLRREVYLVLKESLNNVIRHSGCTEAKVDFRLEHHSLRLTISDNGRGFDLAAATRGHGLKSIRERARRLGGIVTWQSGPDGTSVELRAPLRVLTTVGTA